MSELRNRTPLTPGQQKLAADNVGLVFHWAYALAASRPAVRRIGDDEAVSAGMLGLVRAARGYRPGSYAFASYAARSIQSAIMDATRTSRRMRLAGHLNRVEAVSPDVMRELVESRQAGPVCRYTAARAALVELVAGELLGDEADMLLALLKGWRQVKDEAARLGVCRSALSVRMSRAARAIRAAMEREDS